MQVILIHPCFINLVLSIAGKFFNNAIVGNGSQHLYLGVILCHLHPLNFFAAHDASDLKNEAGVAYDTFKLRTV